MKRYRMLLYALTAVNVITTYVIIQYTPSPYTVIALFGILLTDVLLRAPLKYAAVIAGGIVYKRGEGTANKKERIGQWRKAVTLQLWLYKTRLWRYAVAFLPAVCLRILSERVHTLAVPYDPQVASAVMVVFSYCILILGVALVEFSLFRYMAVWYLLPLCQHAKHALRLAKTLSLYRMEEIADLCLRTLPFSTTRADWVVHQLNCSKHAYNFFENTKTVNGTLGA